MTSLSHLIFSLSLCTLLSIYTYAQTFDPILTGFANTVYDDGKAMYLRGGSASNVSTLISQTLMINLTVSWPANKPVYRQLSNGPTELTTGSTLSADRKNWIITGNDSSYIYNFDTMLWTDSTPNPIFVPPNTYGSATDPSTGLMYIGVPFGEESNGLVSFGISNFELQSITVAYTNVPYMVRYHIAWNDKLKRVLMFGGSPYVFWPYTKNVSSTFDGLLYDPVHAVVTSFAATGDIPPNRFEGCFEPLNNGTKMILFGGASFDNGTTTRNDLYFLDVSSGKWTRGPDAPDSREAISCGISNNQLIIWGGFTSTGPPKVATLIYDLKTNKWKENYTAPIIPTTTTTTATTTTTMILPTNTTTFIATTTTPSIASTSTIAAGYNLSGGQSGGGSHLIVILGGVLGALALVAAFVGALLFRARRNRSKIEDSSWEPKSVASRSAYGDDFARAPWSQYERRRPTQSLASENMHRPSASDIGHQQRMLYSPSLTEEARYQQRMQYNQPLTEEALYQQRMQYNPPPMSEYQGHSHTRFYPPPPLLSPPSNPDSSHYRGRYTDESVLRGPTSIPDARSYAYPSPPPTIVSQGSTLKSPSTSGSSGSKGRPQIGTYGAQRFSVHPHAVMPKDEKKQGRAIPFTGQHSSQHPHSNVDRLENDFLESYYD
ncbi:hypothetical protein EDD21DRAFT_440695 [Dissophora ornata]|nr:hypothetical protein EDD21DRAFT_440695 [Dissophora ornata]